VEAGTPVDASCIRSTVGSITPSRIAQDGPQEIPGPCPAGHFGERVLRSSRCTTTSVASGPYFTRRSGTTTRISSEASAEL
jgi:hypothetical protein